MVGSRKVEYARLERIAYRRLLRKWKEVPQPVYNWYAHEGKKIADMGAVMGVSRIDACSVVAILSPMVSWEVLLRCMPSWFSAHFYKHNYPVMPGFWFNHRKAEAYLRGQFTIDLFTSPKVFSFRLNLLGELGAVTIDRYALRAALGPHAHPQGAMSVGLYLTLERAYQRVGDRVGIAPALVQSGIWELERGGGNKSENSSPVSA